MVFGSHANTRAMYSTPPWPSLAASMAAYRRRSFSDNHPKKRCIFSSISAEYTSMIDSLSQNLSCYKDTTAQACREVIHDHILSACAMRSKDAAVLALSRAAYTPRYGHSTTACADQDRRRRN